MLFDRFNLPDDVFEIIFATKQQKIIGKALIEYMKANDSEITKTQMSFFATQLHEGKYTTTIDEEGYRGREVKLSYNKRQFYDRILTPSKSMGIIDYDLYKKTYSLSDKFRNELIRIGLMWVKELKKPHR